MKVIPVNVMEYAGALLGLSIAGATFKLTGFVDSWWFALVPLIALAICVAVGGGAMLAFCLSYIKKA